METTRLCSDLQRAHAAFLESLNRFSPEAFERPPAPGKWSAGQQLAHIVKSVRPVRLGLLLPVAVPRLLFGPPGHEPMPYEVVVDRYQKKLADGFKAPAPYVPGPVPYRKKEALANALTALVDAIVERAVELDETQLDTVCFPHPSLGRITLREMLLFTLYHVRHHQHQVEALPA